MNYRRETTKMGVPARYREPARHCEASAEADGPLRRGGRAAGQPQGVGPEAHLNGTSQG